MQGGLCDSTPNEQRLDHFPTRRVRYKTRFPWTDFMSGFAKIKQKPPAANFYNWAFQIESRGKRGFKESIRLRTRRCLWNVMGIYKASVSRGSGNKRKCLPGNWGCCPRHPGVMKEGPRAARFTFRFGLAYPQLPAADAVSSPKMSLDTCGSKLCRLASSCKRCRAHETQTAATQGSLCCRVRIYVSES